MELVAALESSLVFPRYFRFVLAARSFFVSHRSLRVSKALFPMSSVPYATKKRNLDYPHPIPPPPAAWGRNRGQEVESSMDAYVQETKLPTRY